MRFNDREFCDYILIGGDQKEYGPVAEEELRQWIRDGRAAPHSQVKVAGGVTWRPISQVPELADACRGIISEQAAAKEAQMARLKGTMKLLVWIELAMIFCTIVLGSFGSLLPEQLQSYKASQNSRPYTPIEMVGACLCLVLLPTALAGSIGLLLNWKPARGLYLLTRISVVAICPLIGPSVEAGITDMFDGAAVLAGGVIIGLLYFSALKDSYGKGKAAV